MACINVSIPAMFPWTNQPRISMDATSHQFSASLYNSPNDSEKNDFPPETPSSDARPRKKRNKPTLNCEKCVERKTKCDRGRPHCLACIRRGSECRYTEKANVLEESGRGSHIRKNLRKPIRPIQNTVSRFSPQSNDEGNQSGSRILVKPDPQLDFQEPSIGSPNVLLSNVPYSHPSASNIYGIGSEYPFSNYWTLQGGLGEVIAVLPRKEQADVLIAKYFEAVDPVYPMLHRQTFYAEYEELWALVPERRERIDGTFIALVFIMLAMGTQFVALPVGSDRAKCSEFYASASHQALRLTSFLNQPSILSIQTMVLMNYFLMNDNHVSDGWAFAGVLIRQAYALGLNRDPSFVVPNASHFVKQQRRRLWQSVLVQDTFLTVLLKLPPTVTHSDVTIDDLIEVDQSSIASPDPGDIGFMRAMWNLANLVQEALCSPRSLDLPISSTTRHKGQLVSQFRAIYRNFSDVFRAWDEESVSELAKRNPRLARQLLFLTSNYFHCLMLVHSEDTEAVPAQVRGALEAAHNGMQAFFLLHSLFRTEADMWWVFQHRAFSEALVIADLIKKHGGDSVNDPIFERSKADVLRMIEILHLSENDEVARTRASVLTNHTT
ncbi:MAG: hypothetical protein M1834_005997 [Cirrosporium novae-zelandiae]|nr:MAG: hypothetical protein M1834_005997 [Cirrosporium novae-zelandiae]